MRPARFPQAKAGFRAGVFFAAGGNARRPRRSRGMTLIAAGRGGERRAAGFLPAARRLPASRFPELSVIPRSPSPCPIVLAAAFLAVTGVAAPGRFLPLAPFSPPGPPIPHRRCDFYVGAAPFLTSCLTEHECIVHADVLCTLRHGDGFRAERRSGVEPAVSAVKLLERRA